MIQTVWPYLALMPLAAGVFPSLEKRFQWRVFSVLPPIVWTYLFVTALAVGGLWTATPEIQGAQRTLTSLLLPALLFLLMVTCDLRAILAVGPRVLGVFACAMLSILLAVTLVFVLFRSVLPVEGWKMLAALSATWTGGSANLVAVKQVIGLSESALPSVLLADALCYSVWVLVLFSTGAFAPAFNRWTGADRGGHEYPRLAAVSSTGPPRLGHIVLWLGLAIIVGLGAARLARSMPTSAMLTQTSWTVLLATVAGLVIARTPLARIPGPAWTGSALLALLVAVLASQSNFHGLASAPLFILCGFITMLLHIGMLALLARVFRFDLYLCGISSLAQIGGVASAPVLAATYSPVLVPIAVLLAMLGLILGTGMGLFMASVLSSLAPAGAG
ncbi:membrane protein [Steroidobacter agaridevorans]|uniref:Membrane protein n=1 Tax=Steroidobacter agaridevorans TaxID=2695856 RepID=A0A829YH20_9GAMM|nr:DUF819 family protein [Steroidobacter agaridevorans]GFE82121.1 membrane protein [Steroidobacter agaridevorans]